jgi:hypothetical protein
MSRNMYALSVPLHHDITIFFIYMNQNLIHDMCLKCCYRFKRSFGVYFKLNCPLVGGGILFTNILKIFATVMKYLYISPNSHSNIAVFHNNLVLCQNHKTATTYYAQNTTNIAADLINEHFQQMKQRLKINLKKTIH